MTSTETRLWGYLKTSPLGYKFRRQHPWACYIFDFYSHGAKMVIEVDGIYHNIPRVKGQDELRDTMIIEHGLTIFRFTDEDVFSRLTHVKEEIQAYLSRLKHPSSL